MKDQLDMFPNGRRRPDRDAKVHAAIVALRRRGLKVLPSEKRGLHIVKAPKKIDFMKLHGREFSSRAIVLIARRYDVAMPRGG